MSQGPPTRQRRPRLPRGPLATVGVLAAVVAVALAVGVVTASPRDRGEPEAAVRIAPATPTTTVEAAPTTTPTTTAPPTRTATAAPTATATETAPAAATAAASAAATVEPAPSSATPTITAGPTVTAGSTPAPVAPFLLEVPPTVGTGQTLAIRVRGPVAGSAHAQFNGGTYPLTAIEGGYWGLIGISIVEALGEYEVGAVVRDEAGAVVGTAAASFAVVPVERPIDYLQLTEEQSSVLTPEASARERELRGQQFAQFDGPWRWEAQLVVPVVGRHTTQYGQARSINDGPVGGYHTGEDIAAELGTPVGAAAAGRVSWAGAMPIRGNSVVLDHGGGVKSGYHHLDSIAVAAEQVVEAGQVIGLLGSTGLSTGPHVHWELTIWGVNVDPMQWTREAFTP